MFDAPNRNTLECKKDVPSEAPSSPTSSSHAPLWCSSSKSATFGRDLAFWAGLGSASQRRSNSYCTHREWTFCASKTFETPSKCAPRDSRRLMPSVIIQSSLGFVPRRKFSTALWFFSSIWLAIFWPNCLRIVWPDPRWSWSWLFWEVSWTCQSSRKAKWLAY